MELTVKQWAFIEPLSLMEKAALKRKTDPNGMTGTF